MLRLPMIINLFNHKKQYIKKIKIMLNLFYIMMMVYLSFLNNQQRIKPH